MFKKIKSTEKVILRYEDHYIVIAIAIILNEKGDICYFSSKLRHNW